jgi:hypothetical protein
VLSGGAWAAVFGVAAAWFGWQAIRARGAGTPGGARCRFPVPHLIECAAMLYMLLPARSPGHAPAMAMAGMSGVGSNPAVALVLALFMLGYILWTTDKLADLWRASTAAASRTENGPSLLSTAPWPATSGGLTPRPPAPRFERGGTGAPLAPRFAACYKIAMSVAMGYMLVMML